MYTPSICTIIVLILSEYIQKKNYTNICYTLLTSLSISVTKSFGKF